MFCFFIKKIPAELAHACPSLLVTCLFPLSFGPVPSVNSTLTLFKFILLHPTPFLSYSIYSVNTLWWGKLTYVSLCHIMLGGRDLFSFTEYLTKFPRTYNDVWNMLGTHWLNLYWIQYLKIRSNLLLAIPSRMQYLSFYLGHSSVSLRIFRLFISMMIALNHRLRTLLE